MTQNDSPPSDERPFAADDLPIGPTVLEPGHKDPSAFAQHLALWLTLPLTLTLIAILLVFYVFFSSAVVVGQSMEPTLHGGDYLLVSRGDSAPHRGDVVVASVLDRGVPTELVKRVVAVGGDTVVVRGDVAIVNGTPEPQRGQVIIPQFAVSEPLIHVPPGSVYLMGDNRANSEDSRYIGPVSDASIEGKVVFIFAPIYRIRPV
jgi:signal peptidase I